MTADPKGNPLPMLATIVPSPENGGVSADGLLVTYHMRKDAKWTDGVPVASKDVKWSWSAIMNNANNVVSRHGYDYVKGIDTPDDYTVVVHLKQKFSPFVNTFFAESDQPFPVGAGARARQVSEHQRSAVQQRTQRQRRPVPLCRMVAQRPHRPGA